MLAERAPQAPLDTMQRLAGALMASWQSCIAIHWNRRKHNYSHRVYCISNSLSGKNCVRSQIASEMSSLEDVQTWASHRVNAYYLQSLLNSSRSKSSAKCFFCAGCCHTSTGEGCSKNSGAVAGEICGWQVWLEHTFTSLQRQALQRGRSERKLAKTWGKIVRGLLGRTSFVGWLMILMLISLVWQAEEGRGQSKAADFE